MAALAAVGFVNVAVLSPEYLLRSKLILMTAVVAFGFLWLWFMAFNGVCRCYLPLLTWQMVDVCGYVALSMY